MQAKTGTRRRWFILVVVLMLGVSLIWGVATAFSASPSPSPAAGKVVLRVGWQSEPDSLNPFVQGLIAAFVIDHLNYDLLFGYKAEDFSPTPELAAEIPTQANGGISADGKTWTVKLRQGVKWQDGEPFTAKDVAFTFNYIIKNDLSTFAMFTKDVKDVQAIDDYTVQFNLVRPKSNFLAMWVPIVPEHIWKSVSPEQAGGKYPNNPPIIGTGPFQVVEWKRGSYIRLVANKDYWRAKPAVDEIIVNFYKNANVMADELKTGALDAADGIPDAAFKGLANVSGLTSIQAIRKGFEELGFNTYTGGKSLGNPVLQDAKFRQALNYAVDKQKILDVAWLGYGEKATSVVQPGYFPTSLDYHWQPTDAEIYPFDLEKAKAELDAAGYTDTNGDGVRDYKGKPIVLRLAARTNSAESQRAGKLITGWFTQIGLQMKYSVMDEATLMGHQYNMVGAKFVPDYDMFLWDWVGIGVDPNFILSIFLTDQIASWSDSAYSNPSYDQMYNQQMAMVDLQQRKQVVWDMQKLLYEQTPYVTLVYARYLEAYNTAKWEGWTQAPNGGAAVYNADNVDSYIFLRPKTAVTESTSSAGSALTIILIVVAAIVVVAIAVVVLVRRRGGAVEE